MNRITPRNDEECSYLAATNRSPGASERHLFKLLDIATDRFRMEIVAGEREIGKR
jgi:hypothetical protein